MSAEQDYRTALLAYPPLVALVGDRVALHAAPDGAALPIVVYAGQAEHMQVLAGAADVRVTFTTECWAATAEEAIAVADAVEAAVLAFDGASTGTSATVLERTGTHDPESGLDGVVLTVEWWP